MAPRTEPLATIRPSVRRAAGRRGRPLVLLVAGLVALALAVVLGVALGSVSIAPGDTVAILARAIGLDLPRTWSEATQTIVLDLRLPRVLTAMVVGTGLAVAGATFQGLLRNPLADPYVLGAASAAAIAAAIAVLIPVRVVILQFGLLHGLAFVGALSAVYTVYRLAQTGGLAPLYARATTMIGHVDESLTIYGLQHIWLRNAK